MLALPRALSKQLVTNTAKLEQRARHLALPSVLSRQRVSLGSRPSPFYVRILIVRGRTTRKIGEGLEPRLAARYDTARRYTLGHRA